MTETVTKKSRLQEILDRHTKPGDTDGGYESFVRALASGDLRTNLIDGAPAVNLMILRPELAGLAVRREEVKE